MAIIGMILTVIICGLSRTARSSDRTLILSWLSIQYTKVIHKYNIIFTNSCFTAKENLPCLAQLKSHTMLKISSCSIRDNPLHCMRGKLLQIYIKIIPIKHFMIKENYFMKCPINIITLNRYLLIYFFTLINDNWLLCNLVKTTLIVLICKWFLMTLNNS